jgi:threonine dehydratase
VKPAWPSQAPPTASRNRVYDMADTVHAGSVDGADSPEYSEGSLRWPLRVEQAVAAIAGKLERTPTLRSDALDEWFDRSLWFKAEGLQRTGAYKVRGMIAQVAALTDDERAAGLITVSSGNAALGAAYAARMYGCQLTVVMPAGANPHKMTAVREMGATIVFDGLMTGTEAFARAAQIQKDAGLHFLHPYDHPDMIAGNATATLELLDDAPELDFLITPTAGGGLLSGAIIARSIRGSSARLVGVQPVAADALIRSLRARTRVSIDHPETVADGLTAPGPGVLNFALISNAGVSAVAVTEEQILQAMNLIVRHLRVVVEPSAAAALACLLVDEPVVPARATVGIILSGSNVSWPLLAATLAK